MHFKTTTSKELSSLAKCHQAAFPDSFTTKLGNRYVAKMLEWYLSTDKAFLFHLEKDHNIVGFCGAIIADGTLPSGSASSMAQFSFNDALRSIFFRPWLLFHPIFIKQRNFFLRNIKSRVMGKKGTVKSNETEHPRKKEPVIGLVVIAVDPKLHGQGLGTLLLQEFEKRAMKYGIPKYQLSVRANNKKAIKSYLRNGWLVEEETPESLTMTKIQNNSLDS